MPSLASHTKSRFSAELIRTKGTNLKSQLDLLAPFAEELAQKAQLALSQLSEFPVKVTVLSVNTEKLTPLFQSESGFDIVSPAGLVSCWRKSDRQFDGLICELCLGSSGGHSKLDETERPATSFERKVSNLISEKLVGAVSDALSEIGEHVDLVVQSRARVATRKSESAVLCYNVHLLLNVFDDACECEILLSLAECLKLLGAETAKHMNAVATAGPLVANTQFAVEVYLKPDVVDVRQILNLAPGKVLKLNIGASAPVELRMNGRKISMGSLSFDQSGGRIKILSDAPTADATKSSLQNLVGRA